MSVLKELIDSLTEDDGIRPDFVEAVVAAYDEDVNPLIEQISTLEAAAIENAEAHSREIENVKAGFFDKFMSGNIGEVDGVTVTAIDESNDDDDGSDDEPFFTDEDED